MEQYFPANGNRLLLMAAKQSAAADDLPPRTEAAWWFDELRAPLHRYLRCIGLTEPDAEEVVQETFLRLFRHLTRSGSRSNLRGWIFKVARNAARDRRRSARAEQSVELDLAAEVSDPSAGPEAAALRKERARKLQDAIVTLSGPQRECILLRMSGLRYREIAEVMGINIASAGELAQRAMAKLSEELL